jgi:hypothetical protein
MRQGSEWFPSLVVEVGGREYRIDVDVDCMTLTVSSRGTILDTDIDPCGRYTAAAREVDAAIRTVHKDGLRSVRYLAQLIEALVNATP